MCQGTAQAELAMLVVELHSKLFGAASKVKIHTRSLFEVETCRAGFTAYSHYVNALLHQRCSSKACESVALSPSILDPVQITRLLRTLLDLGKRSLQCRYKESSDLSATMTDASIADVVIAKFASGLSAAVTADQHSKI